MSRVLRGVRPYGEEPVDIVVSDGVITLDLTAISAVLDQTGPVESPVYGTVDGARLGQILLIDAYQEFGQEGATERQQAPPRQLSVVEYAVQSGAPVSEVRALVELLDDPGIDRYTIRVQIQQARSLAQR